MHSKNYHKLFKIPGEVTRDKDTMTSFIKSIISNSNRQSFKIGKRLMEKEVLFAADGDDLVRDTTTMRLSGRLVRIPRILNPLHK